MATVVVVGALLTISLRGCVADVRQAFTDDEDEPDVVVDYCDSDCAAEAAGELFMNREYESAMTECQHRGPAFTLGCTNFVSELEEPEVLDRPTADEEDARPYWR